MWNLTTYKTIFAIIGTIGIILLCAPTIAAFVKIPAGESYTEMYLLGPNHTASGYPHNIDTGTNYTIYLGITNHMGNAEYYKTIFKFRNTTEPLPNATLATPSNLPAIYTYNSLLGNEKTWEQPVTFSISNVTIEQNMSTTKTITINGFTTNINKSSSLDNTTGEYRYELIVELWIYNGQTEDFIYHNRYVGLYFNLTGITS
jgi:hypothetical protein